MEEQAKLNLGEFLNQIEITIWKPTNRPKVTLKSSSILKHGYFLVYSIRIKFIVVLFVNKYPLLGIHPQVKPSYYNSITYLATSTVFERLRSTTMLLLRPPTALYSASVISRRLVGTQKKTWEPQCKRILSGFGLNLNLQEGQKVQLVTTF